MELSIVQIILVALIAGIYRFDRIGTQINGHNCVLWATLAGLVIGDPFTGMQIGATCMLMSLGVAALGGSSVPDYIMAAIVGTVVTVTTGQDMSVGLTIGIAVGLLWVQIDVIVKTLNIFMAHKQLDFAHKGNYGMMKAVTWIGPVLFCVGEMLPVLIVMLIGGDAVNAVLNAMPAWFTGGLSIAGGILPVVGMAMLLNYMPVKQFFSFVVIGFVLSAYLGLGILPIAMLAGAAAYEYYKSHAAAPAAAAQTSEGVLEDE
ncbi:PTS mannose/fructose/sorbose/N-acetylgalactosamine transporter subunit IIC [Enorma phocaeensis]|uniref:PTS mannose/fructose/sorbose/N-acetylgalactosamine transporter subunit IIC n=1 Tax=Enorma phocaeensis TaxID=1871019 RepID=UPI000C84B49D|nr:PTS sugar transporter subunit IIC [Enorma phocaeensis]